MWKETKFLCSLDDLSGKRDNVMKGFLSHFLGSFWGNPKAKAAKASDKGTETLKSRMHYFHLRVWEWEVISLELLLIRIHHLIQYIGSFCNKVLIIKSESFLQTFTNHKGKTINPPSVLPPSLWWMSISPFKRGRVFTSATQWNWWLQVNLCEVYCHALSTTFGLIPSHFSHFWY